MDIRINRSGTELTHWGIKGQKWGVRRYQNPDGSYTEEGIKRYQRRYPYQNPDGSLTESGRKNYMNAARTNKLDYKRLSDKDLDMINNRFNKENQYKRNIEDYEKSTFKYRTKEAIIARIKGGGKNSGGKKNKNGDSLIGKLLLSPIKKAITDALKESNNIQNGRDVVDNNRNRPVSDVNPPANRTPGQNNRDRAVSDVNPSANRTPEQNSRERMPEWLRREQELREISARTGIIIAHRGTTRYRIKRKKQPDTLIG